MKSRQPPLSRGGRGGGRRCVAASPLPPPPAPPRPPPPLPPPPQSPLQAGQCSRGSCSVSAFEGLGARSMRHSTRPAAMSGSSWRQLAPHIASRLAEHTMQHTATLASWRNAAGPPVASTARRPELHRMPCPAQRHSITARTAQHAPFSCAAALRAPAFLAAGLSSAPVMSRFLASPTVGCRQE